MLDQATIREALYLKDVIVIALNKERYFGGKVTVVVDNISYKIIVDPLADDEFEYM